MHTVTCVVVEDEPLALDTLREMLQPISWLTCVGVAMDGASATRVIDELQPDLIFLDIELPISSGMQVLEQIDHEPAVIFTTAYDRYAVAAFELGAVDYLLKPFRQERLLAAVERFAHTADSARRTANARAREVFGTEPLTRIFVRQHDRILPLPVNTIERLEAEGDYVALYAGGKRHLIHVALADLEQRLDRNRFCRIHRSHIVNLDFVSSIAPLGPSRLEIQMRDGARIAASRSRSRDLRQMVL